MPRVQFSFHLAQEIVLPLFSDPSLSDSLSLDVCRTLSISLDCTRCFVLPLSFSFLLIQATWVSRLLFRPSVYGWSCHVSDIQGFECLVSVPSSVQARSTGAVSASWAESGGASLDDTCRAATWSSHTMFVSLYRLVWSTPCGATWVLHFCSLHSCAFCSVTDPFIDSDLFHFGSVQFLVISSRVMAGTRRT